MLLGEWLHRLENELEFDSQGIHLPRVMSQVEEAVVRKALHLTEDNITHASRLLGVARSTLTYKKKNFDAKAAISKTSAS